MAKLSFTAKMIDSSSVEPSEIIAFELNRDIDAACDGLRLSFLHDAPLGEIDSIMAYENDELIFNGYVDVQRQSVGENGFECFVFARSSACRLVDNEASPCTYSYPTAQVLFIKNAEIFGFKSALPTLFTRSNYAVKKGTSCFGAINDFVYALAGRGIVVTPHNEVIIPSGEGRINLDDFRIVSERRCINRGELISQVDYKIDGDNDYSRHAKSVFLEERGICRSKKINLQAYPQWQRENVAVGTIKEKCPSYRTVELVLDGCHSFNLYDRVCGKTRLGDFDGYYVTGACTSFNSRGESTRLLLCGDFDLEATTYVD